MDPSAIIEGGRRSRNAKNNVSYKGLDASDDDEDDDNDDDDDDNNNDSEEEKPKKKQKKVSTKKKPQAAATASIKPGVLGCLSRTITSSTTRTMMTMI